MIPRLYFFFFGNEVSTIEVWHSLFLPEPVDRERDPCPMQCPMAHGRIGRILISIVLHKDRCLFHVSAIFPILIPYFPLSHFSLTLSSSSVQFPFAARARASAFCCYNRIWTEYSQSSLPASAVLVIVNWISLKYLFLLLFFILQLQCEQLNKWCGSGLVLSILLFIR